MAATTTAGRAIRRQICAKHGIEYGQVYDPGVPGERESFWIGGCRECEKELRAKQRADEELAQQADEIRAEAERRIAADPEHEKKIQERAAEALAEEVAGIVTNHCAMRRPEWESYFDDVRWNEVVAEVEEEKHAELVERLRSAERG